MKHTAAVLLLVAAMSAQNAPSTKGRHLDIPAISQEANGAIVSIVMSDKDGHPLAQGSGFLISKDGKVVTNYHVIRNGASAVIKFPDGAFFAADGVLASDKDRDVAIIKVHGNGFKALTLGDSDRLQVGEEVVAIGNPLSLESTVSNGIVSAIRTVEDEGGKFLQITAPISPGSSGGPLFNMAGKVVGITTSHIKGGENLNFAIPINDVKPMLQVQLHAGSPPLPAGYFRPGEAARPFPDEPEPETVTPAQSTGPSLADTLRWMVESSADGVQYHEEYSPPASGFLLSSFHIMTQDSSCHAFTIITTIIYQHGTKSGANRFFVKFDLGDVDPDSIHQSASWGIVFSATDNQHRISVLREMAEDADHLNSGRLISDEDSAIGQDNFLISDDNYRSRLENAFKHAVVLCGGKPSTF
jgi:hypothetical protein